MASSSEEHTPKLQAPPSLEGGTTGREGGRGDRESVVEATHLTKSYGGSSGGGQLALADVSFTIAPGEIFALLGPNGAGKSTLLRILTGILTPDSGSARVLGRAVGEGARDQVGYLPEERGLYKREPIGETLAYFAELKGAGRAAAKAMARAALERVGMGAHFANRPDALSKGMAQRIQIAAAIVHDPPFLILDEPFSGLDPVSARQAREIVRDERARGRTILLSTHQMSPVEELCDRLMMLHRGRTVLYGPVADVRRRFASGIARIEHREEALAAEALPDGFTVVGAEGEATASGVTRVALPDGAHPDALLRHLITAGIGVTGFSAESPTLEEIFVRLVAEDDAEKSEIAAELAEST